MQVLFVGQTPPPFHGQAVVNQMLFEHDWGERRVERLRMAFSREIDDVGRGGIGKAVHLVELIAKTWWKRIRYGCDVLYYPPASANKVPVLRDIVYLAAVRWMFSKTVFHFHAGGLAQYLDGAGLVGKLGKWVYRKPDLSIELYKEDDSPGEAFGAGRVVVVANGLEMEKEFAARAFPRNRKRTILFVGSLREDKGVLDLIETAKLLKERGNGEFVFEVAGGWASEEFEETARELVNSYDLADQVKWLGTIQGEEKMAAFERADAFFFPTYYHSEKFPLVLIEALAAALPVVSTEWRGIPQLMDGSGAGELCEVKRSVGFADAIERVFEDEMKYEQLSENALQHYKVKYTKEMFLRNIEEALGLLEPQMSTDGHR